MSATGVSSAASPTSASSATGGHIPLPHTVSYAKSSRSQCKGCHKVIEARQLRMGVTSLSPFFDGTVVKYYHVPCYFKRKRTAGVDTSKLDGFKGIQYADQDNLRKLFGEPTVYDATNATKDFAALVGKLNNHSLSPIEENFLDWQLREKLEDKCGIPLVKELLLLNRQPVYGGEDDVLRRCAQGLLYGAVEKCPKCAKGNLHYNELENNWTCSEFASAWGKCPFSIDGFRSAPRRPFTVQYTTNKFLLEWCRLRGEPMPKAKSDILQGLKIVLAGRVGRTKVEMEEFLERHSAELHAKIVLGSTTHVISSDNVVYKGSPATDLATKHNVPIVYEEFLDECINAGKIVQFDRFVIIRGKPKSFSDNGELIVLDASGGLRSSYSSIPGTSGSAGGTSTAPLQPIGGSGVKSSSATFVPSNIQLLGFDEDDYMVDNSTPLDYSATLADFNTHAGLLTTTFDSLIDEPHLTESQFQGELFDLVHSYQSAMIGFEARETSATPPPSAAHDNERALSNDPKNRRWPTLPGLSYSRIAKKYVEAETELAATHHIYESRDETGKVTLYDVTLNQTELSSGRNAYYRIQLLAPDAPTSKKFFVFFRWGRVGTDSGSSKLQPATSLESALREFEKKFYDKTSNRWKESLTGGFIKCGGKMFPLEMEYEDDVDTENDGSGIPSQLLPEVQDLVKLIFDPTILQRALEAMKIDVEKMPLGKISKAMILEGYRALRRIDDALRSSMDAAARNHLLADLSGRFYTIVPHSFGRDKPPIIDSAALLAEKLEMLQTLTDIEVASALIKESKRSTDNSNPLDRNYARLKTTITPLDMSSPMAKLIAQYAYNSKAHSEVGDIVIDQIYAIEREGEKAKAAKYDFLANRQFLWHGSRLSNFAGILSQGLRIAPPEAPVSGYMFGKGVYLADMFSKSAAYCHLQESNGTGLLLLCETILGDMLELTQGKYIERSYLESIGKNSTKGVGKVAPSPKAAAYLDHSHRATAPLGLIESTGATNSELDQNEYIVYDTAQVVQGFLLKIRLA